MKIMENKKSFNAIYRFLFMSLMLIFILSCSTDDEKGEFNKDNVPELLYGRWLGADSRGQSLSFLIERDGSCTYKRSRYTNTYVSADGVYTYDAKEKKITTTIEEIGEGPIVYIIELLSEDKLVVKKASYDTRIIYTRDKDYEE